VKLKPVTLVFVVLAAGALYGFYGWWTSDERQLRRQLGELEASIEKSGEESNLAAVDRARRLTGLLAERFTVVLEPYAGSVSDRGELQRLFFAYRSGYDTISADFDAEEIEIDPVARIANMKVEAVLLGQRKGGGPGREGYRLVLRWVENGGDWQLERVELAEIR